MRKRCFDNLTGGTLLEPKKHYVGLFFVFGTGNWDFCEAFGLATVYEFRNNRCGLQFFNCYTAGPSCWKAN